MQVRVLFLGPAKDFAGTDGHSIDLEVGSTVGRLRELLAQRYTRLGKALSSIRMAVNNEFVSDDHLLESDDEVALIPPVSGGSIQSSVRVDITADSIDVASVCRHVQGDPALGAIVTFVGVTRDESHPTHGSLKYLAYEAYDSMARSQLMKLAGIAIERREAGRVAIVHRVGAVPPGDPSVVIGVACAHRAEAFEACRWLIDTIKRDVPIWKKDVFADGETRWVQPTETTKPAVGR